MFQDVRWTRFNNPDYACPCCGQSFTGLFDLAYDCPDPWQHETLAVTGGEPVERGNHRLTDWFCQIDETFYLRGAMRFPIKDTGQALTYQVWASILADNFQQISDCRAAADFSAFPECNGWIVNRLPGWDMTRFIGARIQFDGANLPRFTVSPNMHEVIGTAQQRGISFDVALDRFADEGYDIRPHLMGK